MEIIIEIGNDEQKDLINREMIPIFDTIRKLDPPLNLGKVVLAANFDAKINELQKTTTYQSVRGVTAIAKIVELDVGESIAIVLSPMLFTEEHDTETRYFIYMHEVIHVINKQKFPKIVVNSTTSTTYVGNLHSYFDEYVADRIAYGFTDDLFRERSPRAQAMIDNTVKGMADLICDQKYYTDITQKIWRFRTRQIDVERFLESIKRSFDEVSLCTIHLFALLHQYPQLASNVDLSSSRFVNQKTDRFLNYIKGKYERREYDLRDGIDLVVDYMTNFAMRFEERLTGPYCHILDI